MSILQLFVNESSRKLSNRSSDQVFVVNDANVDTIRFSIPAGFSDIDVDENASFRVMYIPPGIDKTVYAKTLTFVQNDGVYISYDWQVGPNVLVTSGILTVSFCILKIEPGLQEWHTIPYQITVSNTIHTDDSDEGDETITPTVAQRVAVLESMIQRVASGAPIVVASTSAMTDTDQIYVLSTDGKWYYHNGSAWVAGGEYGAVSTDTTLTQSGMAADSKATGDAISTLNKSLADKAPASTVYTKTQVDAALANKVSTVNGVEPDATGNVIISAGGGIDGTAITLLMTILNEGLYGSNQSDNLVSLNAALRGHSLVSISAVVDGVPLAGTPFSEVPFIVTATYSDDSTATVSNYTVSSGTVVNGSNTATISYGGMSTTVTFTASDTRAYTITYNLTNVTSSNNTTLIAENSSYTATLSVSGNDYEMNTCTITMGGTDVTSAVLSGNDILIQSVTGNVVIAATAARIVYLDPLKKTKNSGYSIMNMYSDEFVTRAKAVDYNGICGVTEFPALSECSIGYTLTNNTDSDISLNGVGIGMVPSYDSENILNMESGLMRIAHWVAIDNSNHTLSPGSSLTGRITLKKGYQLAFTAGSMTAYDNLTLALTGGYEADRFVGYRQIVDNAALAIFGGYRGISFYSDNGTTALKSGNNPTHRNIASDIAVGTYDVQFRYVPTDVMASSTNQFVFAAGMVADATATTSNYGFGWLNGKTSAIPFVWVNGSLTVSESGMTLTDSGSNIPGGDGSYVDIRIKEAA